MLDWHDVALRAKNEVIEFNVCGTFYFLKKLAAPVLCKHHISSPLVVPP
jgi:hypothetical protein